MAAAAMRLALLLLVALVSWPAHAVAQAGRYRVEGDDGRSVSSAVVQKDGQGWRVSVESTALDGTRYRAKAQATLDPRGLAFPGKAQPLGTETLACAVDARRSGRGVLTVAWRDAAGRTLRRETWTKDLDRRDHVVVPVTVVALGGPPASEGEFPGVSAEQAAAAQTTALAALDRAFGPLGVRFKAAADAPLLLDGAKADADEDGELSRPELAALRDDLERRGVKQRGQVTLVLTAAPFVAADCRGWTLGDVPSVQGSLADHNDNFSVVGLSFLDPSRFHTVAHEVGHQLGLDDLRADNRPQLEQPGRDDHLMESGGCGHFVDPAAGRIVRHGLAPAAGAARSVPTAAD